MASPVSQYETRGMTKTPLLWEGYGNREQYDSIMDTDPNLVRWEDVERLFENMVSEFG